jgi:hypothetical protein
MSDMEPKEWQELSAERSTVADGSPVQNESVQTCTETEDEPGVIELASQVREALAPVKAPPTVRDKLRVELLEVAQHRQCEDVRVESPSRRREWALGAVIGSAVALVGGLLYLLRSRLEGPSPVDKELPAADSK